ncbi:MAG: hypothetical protein ACP5I4_03690 [Oceanipulchritudo sp.]|jgi:hypothetical protein
MENSKRNGRKEPARGLWAWVILAFVVLILAWAALILIATTNQPEIIKLDEGQGTRDKGLENSTPSP